MRDANTYIQVSEYFTTSVDGEYFIVLTRYCIKKAIVSTSQLTPNTLFDNELVIVIKYYATRFDDVIIVTTLIVYLLKFFLVHSVRIRNFYYVTKTIVYENMDGNSRSEIKKSFRNYSITLVCGLTVIDMVCL